MHDGIQIDFDFNEPKNHFKDCLKDGSFFVIFEVNTPAKNRDFDAAAKLASDVEKAAMKVKGLETGLAITDKTESINSWNAAEFANAIVSEKKDNHLVYISGRKSSRSDIEDMMKRCHSAGFLNVVPVTGNGYAEEITSVKSRQTCFDSANTLHLIKNMEDRNAFYPGCVFNPFKYNPGDSFPQYFKLIKKLNFGANFVVSQVGWDMMKHQELRWYLNNRDLHYPTIARLQLLTPEIVNEIIAGKQPGIYIPRDFRIILEKENQFGYKQFASAQWRRIQLQVAGCRLLGYSGIQLAGIEHPEHVSTVVSKIKDALNEFTDFKTWAEAYQDHMIRSDMAPFANRFYLYKNLFTEDHPRDIIINPEGITPCSFFDKINYKLCKSMFSQDHLLSPDEHLLTKKIFTGCSSCSYCRLPLTHYICPETCPKGLANGPCGGTRINGYCEIRERKCIHEKRVQLAAWLNEIDILEERHIKHPDGGGKLKAHN